MLRCWWPAGWRGALVQERSVAVESLMAVAEEFHRAKMAVQAVLPPTETQRLEHFYTRTVDAASDLQEYIFHAASLRLLDLSRQAPPPRPPPHNSLSAYQQDRGSVPRITMNT